MRITDEGAQRKPQSDLIRRLKESIEFYGVGLRTTRGDRIADAIACIEDLAGALRENEFVATTGPLTTDGYKNALEQVKKRARAALERWGLK